MSKYSKTSLANKLGIKKGQQIVFVNTHFNFLNKLGSMPSGVTISSEEEVPYDFVLLFVQSRLEHEEKFKNLAEKLTPTGMIWIAWPKKTSGVFSDLAFDVVQSVGIAAGLVDNIVCAIDDVWSSIRFVVSLKDLVFFSYNGGGT